MGGRIEGHGSDEVTGALRRDGCVQRVLVERLVLRRRSRRARSARARRRAASVLIACQRSRRRAECRSRRAAMPSTSPTAQRTPVSPSRTTSAGRRRSMPITGTPRRQRLERAQAERLALRRQQEEVGAGEQRRDRVDLAEEEHVVLRRRARAPPARRSTRSGPSPTMTSTLGISCAHPREDAHDVAHALHRAEVRDVHQHLASLGAPARADCGS